MCDHFHSHLRIAKLIVWLATYDVDVTDGGTDREAQGRLKFLSADLLQNNVCTSHVTPCRSSCSLLSFVLALV